VVAIAWAVVEIRLMGVSQEPSVPKRNLGPVDMRAYGDAGVAVRVHMHVHTRQLTGQQAETCQHVNGNSAAMHGRESIPPKRTEP
jgi:hypothetical protein